MVSFHNTQKGRMTSRVSPSGGLLLLSIRILNG